MNLSLLVFDASSIVVVAFAIVVMAGLLVFYALRSKGDVRAQFSHGSTMFKLEAKGRPTISQRHKRM